MRKNNKNRIRGGARPRSGPKVSFHGNKIRSTSIDDPTAASLLEIGDGNISGGIRRAVIAINLLPKSARETLLEQARAVESENIQRVREAQEKGER